MGFQGWSPDQLLVENSLTTVISFWLFSRRKLKWPIRLTSLPGALHFPFSTQEAESFKSEIYVFQTTWLLRPIFLQQYISSHFCDFKIYVLRSLKISNTCVLCKLVKKIWCEGSCFVFKFIGMDGFCPRASLRELSKTVSTHLLVGDWISGLISMFSTN